MDLYCSSIRVTSMNQNLLLPQRLTRSTRNIERYEKSALRRGVSFSSFIHSFLICAVVKWSLHFFSPRWGRPKIISLLTWQWNGLLHRILSRSVKLCSSRRRGTPRRRLKDDSFSMSIEEWRCCSKVREQTKIDLHWNRHPTINTSIRSRSSPLSLFSLHYLGKSVSVSHFEQEPHGEESLFFFLDSTSVFPWWRWIISIGYLLRHTHHSLFFFFFFSLSVRSFHSFFLRTNWHFLSFFRVRSFSTYIRRCISFPSSPFPSPSHPLPSLPSPPLPSLLTLGRASFLPTRKPPLLTVAHDEPLESTAAYPRVASGLALSVHGVTARHDHQQKSGFLVARAYCQWSAMRRARKMLFIQFFSIEKRCTRWLSLSAT